MLGLFSGQPGARGWRRILSVEAARPGADWQVVERALDSVLQARAA
jgi:tRNA-dihydrouridine synthase A